MNIRNLHTKFLLYSLILCKIKLAFSTNQSFNLSGSNQWNINNNSNNESVSPDSQGEGSQFDVEDSRGSLPAHATYVGGSTQDGSNPSDPQSANVHSPPLTSTQPPSSALTLDAQKSQEQQFRNYLEKLTKEKLIELIELMSNELKQLIADNNSLKAHVSRLVTPSPTNRFPIVLSIETRSETDEYKYFYDRTNRTEVFVAKDQFLFKLVKQRKIIIFHTLNKKEYLTKLEIIGVDNARLYHVDGKVKSITFRPEPELFSIVLIKLNVEVKHSTDQVFYWKNEKKRKEKFICRSGYLISEAYRGNKCIWPPPDMEETKYSHKLLIAFGDSGKGNLRVFYNDSEKPDDDDDHEKDSDYVCVPNPRGEPTITHIPGPISPTQVLTRSRSNEDLSELDSSQGKKLNHNEYPPDVKLYTLDPSDTSNLILIQKEFYAVRSPSNNLFYYDFDQGVKCIFIQCEDKNIWKFDQLFHAGVYPMNLLYRKSSRLIIFTFLPFVYDKDKNGNWSGRPLYIKLFRSDPVDGGLAEMNSTQYILKDDGQDFTFEFKSGVKCIEVRHKDKPIWKHDGSNDIFPSSIDYSEEETITVILGRNHLLFQLKQDAESPKPEPAPQTESISLKPISQVQTPQPQIQQIQLKKPQVPVVPGPEAKPQSQFVSITVPTGTAVPAAAVPRSITPTQQPASAFEAIDVSLPKAQPKYDIVPAQVTLKPQAALPTGTQGAGVTEAITLKPTPKVQPSPTIPAPAPAPVPGASPAPTGISSAAEIQVEQISASSTGATKSTVLEPVTLTAPKTLPVDTSQPPTPAPSPTPTPPAAQPSLPKPQEATVPDTSASPSQVTHKVQQVVLTKNKSIAPDASKADATLQRQQTPTLPVSPSPAPAPATVQPTAPTPSAAPATAPISKTPSAPIAVSQSKAVPSAPAPASPAAATQPPVTPQQSATPQVKPQQRTITPTEGSTTPPAAPAAAPSASVTPAPAQATAPQTESINLSKPAPKVVAQPAASQTKAISPSVPQQSAAATGHPASPTAPAAGPTIAKAPAPVLKPASPSISQSTAPPAGSASQSPAQPQAATPAVNQNLSQNNQQGATPAHPAQNQVSPSIVKPASAQIQSQATPAVNPPASVSRNPSPAVVQSPGPQNLSHLNQNNNRNSVDTQHITISKIPSHSVNVKLSGQTSKVSNNSGINLSSTGTSVTINSLQSSVSTHSTLNNDDEDSEDDDDDDYDSGYQQSVPAQSTTPGPAPTSKAFNFVDQ